MALFACSLTACEPRVVVGEWICPTPDGGTDFGEIRRNPGDPVRTGWSTSFEKDFCEYARWKGYCYADPGASYTTVSSPVHSGKAAVAFLRRSARERLTRKMAAVSL